MDLVELSVTFLLYLPQIFGRHPELLLYLGVASFVSLHLRTIPWVFRQLASMVTYVGMGLVGILHRYSLETHFPQAFFEFLLELLPSALVAFGVLLLVQYAISQTRQSNQPGPTQRETVDRQPEDSQAISTQSKPWAQAIVAVTLLAGIGMIAGGKLQRSAARDRQETAIDTRPKVTGEVEHFASQAMLDWNEIELDACGLTLAPQGLKVVTRYGFQAIPWEVCREIETRSYRPRFVVEVEKQLICLAPLDEPATDSVFRHWLTAMTKVGELGVMQRTQDSTPTRLTLLREASSAPPQLPQSVQMPAPGGEKYNGLPLATLRTLDCPNGVTLCREGLVVRDVCGVQSVAWKDVQKLLVGKGHPDYQDLQVACGQENRVIELFSSDPATLSLSPWHRYDLQQQIVAVLGLKLTKDDPSSGSRDYVPSRGTVNPPVSPIFYPAQLNEKS